MFFRVKMKEKKSRRELKPENKTEREGEEARRRSTGNEKREREKSYLEIFMLQGISGRDTLRGIQL